VQITGTGRHGKPAKDIAPCSQDVIDGWFRLAEIVLYYGVSVLQ